MEEMRDYLISLYDIYKNLLTEKQQKYFEDYYFLDLSLAEIAESYGISRNGVFDQIKRVSKELNDIESKLKMYERFEKIEKMDISEDLKDDIMSILKE